VVPGRRVLYLAMDRPHQIRRAFRLLDQNLVIWKGPPPADLAKHTEILNELAEQADADVVVVDSLKDAAVGLSEDEVGGRMESGSPRTAGNRAKSACAASPQEAGEERKDRSR